MIVVSGVPDETGFSFILCWLFCCFLQLSPALALGQLGVKGQGYWGLGAWGGGLLAGRSQSCPLCCDKQFLTILLLLYFCLEAALSLIWLQNWLLWVLYLHISAFLVLLHLFEEQHVPVLSKCCWHHTASSCAESKNLRIKSRCSLKIHIETNRQIELKLKNNPI